LELVYLWVEDYKNIKKQGFNFSPRFECKYDDTKKKLIVCYKDDEKCKEKEECKKFCNENYIENFFENNIKITAIVGENGSGKSSILEILTHSLSESSEKHEIFPTDKSKFFLIYKYEGKLYSLKVNLPNSLNITHRDVTDIERKRLFSKKDLIAILLNNESATRRFYHEPFQLFIGNTQQHINNIQEIIFSNFINERNKFFQKDINKFFIPTKIKIISMHNNARLNEEIILCLQDFNMTKAKEKIRLLEKDLKSTSYNLIKSIEQSGTKDLYTFKIKDINEESLKEIFLLKSDLIDIEICDETRGFKNLSYGERQLLTNLNFILFYSKQKEYIKREERHDIDTGKPEYDKKSIEFNKVLVLLDEFELGLHPNWQKKSIKYITDFLQLMGKEFHLIITSHSPFILSDIPKQNIIFLDTYNKEKSEKKYPNLNFDGFKDGNCINVTNEIDIKPFGANIHTLLSDSFFMDKGLMGEFAKNKIEKIMKFLNSDENIKDFYISQQQIKLIIESIGEDLLRMKLLDMYYEKFKKDELEKEKQQLIEKQKEITELIKSIEEKQKK